MVWDNIFGDIIIPQKGKKKSQKRLFKSTRKGTLYAKKEDHFPWLAALQTSPPSWGMQSATRGTFESRFVSGLSGTVI